MENVPHDIDCTASSITLSWEAQCKTHFEVKFKEDTIKVFTCMQTQEQIIEINDLKAKTLYHVKVFAVDEGGTNHEILQRAITTEETKLLYLRDTENVNNIDKRYKPNKYHLKPVNVQDDEYVRTCYLSKYGYSYDKCNRVKFQQLKRVIERARVSNKAFKAYLS